MTTQNLHRQLTYSIALIWLVNGLFCKILNMVPRHGQIVAELLGTEHARLFTILIGCAEILMALWIFSGKYAKLNAITQILVIGTMNLLEMFLVPELLLWGRMNAFFALILIITIYFNEFYLHRKLAVQY